MSGGAGPTFEHLCNALIYEVYFQRAVAAGMVDERCPRLTFLHRLLRTERAIASRARLGG